MIHGFVWRDGGASGWQRCGLSSLNRFIKIIILIGIENPGTTCAGVLNNIKSNKLQEIDDFCWSLCYNGSRETIAVDGSSSREEVIAMYITLSDLLSVGTFLVLLITLILQIKR